MNSSSVIDLRSDTVTLPSKGMRRAIADAEVGDDVLDGDPTTKRLEDRLAELLGHEAALFFPTGTQANQTAVALHADRGTEVVVEATSHLLHYERGAAAAFWGVQLREVVTPDGILTPDLVRAKIRDGSADFPRTSAVVIENTHSEAGGKVTDLATMRGLRELCDAQGVAIHIDGARLWNAAVATGEPPHRLAAFGSTVMVSFSKGLGCPAGSCLAGPKDLLDAAVSIRRGLGGGMRQSGMLAAACLYALDHNMERLADDHAKAMAAADILADHSELSVGRPDTNIVMIDLHNRQAADAAQLLSDAGVRLSVYGPQRLRAVTHLGVSEAEVRRAAKTVAEMLA
ncbi:MAG: aminotransferase class I/II-fold pyridoxal phosphate-dependent enzyme [Gemmatimonadetes bacterium]|nr:aminotransferase class I/II-fold pyridoxal phosphate-dependent enzyme [Gemmatimonadota bacterium]